MIVGVITFPPFSGVRCLMMPYIQGDPESLPADYAAYSEIIAETYIDQGEIGFLTIDESPVKKGVPHRGARAKYGRALHTEAGLRIDTASYGWGWGGLDNVRLDPDVKILVASSIAGSCAIWDAEHPNTSHDGDIGDQADQYPYDQAVILDKGEVGQIGILTPHESLPIAFDADRQFLRIVSSGVHGREPYFTINPLLAA